MRFRLPSLVLPAFFLTLAADTLAPAHAATLRQWQDRGLRIHTPPKSSHWPTDPAIRVEEKTQSRKIVYKVTPVYPAIAKTEGIRGTVRLRAFIDTQGNVQALQYLSGPPLLVPATLRAVRRWEYKPTFLNGKPVNVETTIDVTFGLPERANVQVQSGNALPRLIHRVLPKYPPEAKARGIQGQVLLSAVIRKDGHVEIPRTVSGDPILAKAAIEAVRQWVCEPVLINGKPVEVRTTVTVLFTLSRHKKAKEGQK